ncbi:hypothetical protein NMY22_g1341 [Coprinellus aureogranulatus]|nr:hypothetical protein NMY22_g1341 [Coprinellus aureogranulatus]
MLPDAEGGSLSTPDLDLSESDLLAATIREETFVETLLLDSKERDPPTLAVAHSAGSPFRLPRFEFYNAWPSGSSTARFVSSLSPLPPSPSSSSGATSTTSTTPYLSPLFADCQAWSHTWIRHPGPNTRLCYRPPKRVCAGGKER